MAKWPGPDELAHQPTFWKKKIQITKSENKFQKKDSIIQKSVPEIQIQKSILERGFWNVFLCAPPLLFKVIFVISHKNRVQVQIWLGVRSNCPNKKCSIGVNSYATVQTSNTWQKYESEIKRILNIIDILK